MLNISIINKNCKKPSGGVNKNNIHNITNIKDLR